MNRSCYWCGEAATSADHVPAKCFYPKGMRGNLIKVPSCTKHNTELSTVDERFRYYIQAASESAVAVQEFGGATVRSLSKPEAKHYRASMMKGMRPALLNGQITLAQPVPVDLVRLFFEKITRGLYFFHNRRCFRGSIVSECTHLTTPGRDLRKIVAVFNDMSSGLNDGQATHPDVFKYRFGQVTEPGGHGFAIIGTFYGDVSFFTIGTDVRPAIGPTPS